MSFVKKAISKALGQLGIKGSVAGLSSSRGGGISSKDLAKLTTNTAASHSGIRSNHGKIMGVESW